MKLIENIFPLVSVVITTKDEIDHLLNCIKSVRAQTYQNIELLVVDNYSTDGTMEIAREYADRLFLIGPERSVQRNRGMRDEAKGEFVIFLDADMIMEPNLIEECIKQIQVESADALNIPEHILGKSFFSKCRNFERSFYCNSLIDGVRFMRKEIFKKVDCFDETLTGPEDWDLSKKIKHSGGKIILLNNSHINHNEGEVVLKNYLNKKSYYATSFDKYKEKWGADDLDIKKQLGFYYRYIGVFVENKKYLKLLRHPVLTVGMYYLRIRVGIRYITRKRK